MGLTAVPRFLSALALDVVKAARDEIVGRRVWVRGDRAHIEARGVHHTDVPAEYVTALERAVSGVVGVRWAAVNGVLGDVIADFDRGRVNVEHLRQAVVDVERAYNMGGRSRDRPMHPSDFEPVFDGLLGLAGDLVGAGVGLAGRTVRGLSLPAEAMALPAMIDFAPELRRKLEARFGAARVELVLSLAGSVLGAAAQTPLSVLTDAVLRASELPEALARRHAWESRAIDLAADAMLAKADPLPSPGPRPAPLPDGPVERYARLATVATGLTAAAVMATGRLTKAARTVAIAAPKASGMGANAFAAELGRLLALRGVVVRDPAPLRHLDRIDTVVIEAAALTTGRLAVADVVAATDDSDLEELRQRVAAMLDPYQPENLVRDGPWKLGPLTHLGLPVPATVNSRLRASGGHREGLVGLVLRRRIVAVAVLEKELDPLADAVVAAAHRVGRVVVAPVRSHLADRVGADAAVAGGSRLGASVRAMQADGHAVALIATRNDSALAAADCGIGVIGAGRHPPWAADLLCGPGLDDVWFLLQAAAEARATSHRNVQLAALGAIAGALVGLAGSQRDNGRRSTLPANVAALASIGAGVWSVHRLARRSPPTFNDGTPWHALAVDETLHRLRTGLSGLSDDQADRRRPDVEDDGPEESEGLLAAAVSELDNPLTAPLATGAGLSAANGSVVDAALVSAVMAGNALLGAAQRVSANRAVRRLASAGALRAQVRRAGQGHTAPATELVPGDIVTVQPGDAVPADCRLIDANHLEMDESSLTGESMPVVKDPAPSLAATVADRTSMLYAGTSVAAGTGLAVVVSTGGATEAERSAAATETAGTPSGVEARLRRLTAASVPVAVGAAGAVLAAGLLRGRVRQSLDSAVALAVAAVPEGLPFAATVAQLAAARRLSGRNVLVRTPRTLEALGRVDVVCFDKTGTLTEGRIELRRVSDGEKDEAVDALTGQRRTVLAAALRASPPHLGEGTLPHPTDRAVIAGGAVAGIAGDDGEPDWQMVQELPFEPERGFHAVLGRTARRNVISVKGAAEIVLPRCVARRGAGATRPLTDAGRRHVEEQVERLARSGYRVLAVAERAASPRRRLDAERVERLELLGLLALADPVRPTAAEAVRHLRAAGVEVVMLTGDHPSTAASIAAELNLLDSRPPVTGVELEALDAAGLAEVAARTTVFARVSPAHKVTIVKALRQAGRTVAVTGDGANDAPAIRLADVGIALGEKSTAAARHAADIVIADDHIETIVDAVIESRAMWRSVRDSVGLLLGGNLGEIAFTLVSSVLTARPPLRARQLLMVNLLTDLVPALAVAVRPPRGTTPDALLREGPDAAVGNALTRDIVTRAVATSAATTAAWLVAEATGTRGRASTVALATLVCTQLAQTAATSRRDPVVLAATIASAAALVTLVQFPPTSAFFHSRPLGPLAWTIVLTASTVAALRVHESERRRRT